ncbi:MAG: ABC transporter substrate-binding protein [Actinomycetota bacterium]|nr:ABC transporter substrate-binding protein [Actinomycetota bacterium]
MPAQLREHRWAAIALAAALALAACGGSGDDEDADGTSTAADGTAAATDDATTTTAAADDTAGTSTSAPGTSTTGAAGAPEPELPITLVDDTGTEVTIESIDRIVPLDGDLAEVVFALGLGDNVVATDLSATYPPEADALPEIGYQRSLVPEPIAAMEPTVLLASDLAGPVETLETLRELGFPLVVIDQDPTIDGPATKVRRVGEALGIPDAGEALAAEVEADIDEALTLVPDDVDPPRIMSMYVRGGGLQLVFGEGSGMDALIEAIGGVDVGTELGIEDNGPLTEEALALAAPDVILVTDSGLESVDGIDGLLDASGLARTPAGEDRRVLSYDDQLLFGLGPRTGELITRLVADIHGERAG